MDFMCVIEQMDFRFKSSSSCFVNIDDEKGEKMHAFIIMQFCYIRREVT